MRPRAGSLPPAPHLDLPSAVNTCTDIIEKLGNRFPRLKSKGDQIHRVFCEVLFVGCLGVGCGLTASVFMIH